MDSYNIEVSKDEKYILRIESNRKKVYIGSKYNVQRDIDKFINSIGEYNKETIFICFGLGTGEHIKKLLEIAPENKIYIFEPDKEIIDRVIESKVNNDVLKNKRVILNNCDINVEKYLENEISIFSVNNIKFVFFANYKDCYFDDAIRVYNEYFQFLKSGVINLNTNIVHSKHFFYSFIKNIKYICTSNPINNFKGKFKDKPVVIVSAGPSLEKNIKILKENQDKCIIITGGRTLGTLLQAGIKPDIVCVIDPDVPAYDVMRNSIDSTVPLIFSEFTYFGVLEKYKGRKIFLSDIYMKGVTEKFLKYKVDYVLQGGSVAHVCTGIGVYIGCSPVVFIGQDLAYTNDKSHAASAGNTQITNENIIYVDDVYGNKVKTDYVLDFYRTSLEEIIQNYSSSKFINATEGGANIKGTEVMKLKDVFERYPNSIDKSLQLNGKKIDDIVDLNMIISKLRNTATSLEKVNNKTRRAIKKCSEFLKDSLKWKDDEILKLNSELDKVDKVIRKNMKEIKLINMLMEPCIIEAETKKEYKEKYKESKMDEIKRIYNKSVDLYKGVSEAIEIALPEIKKSIESLEEIMD